MDKGLFYLGIVCTLLVVPRILQRVRIPAPLSCLLFGIFVAQSVPDINGGVILFAAVLGITSLFLFAGLEVSIAQLRRQAAALTLFAIVRLLALAAVAFIAWYGLNISWQAAALISLALLTSSTGFILDSLNQYGIEGEERERVSNEAITGELIGLGVLFCVIQSISTQRFLFSSSVLLALVVAIPAVYFLLTRWILRNAPDAEFSLLVMVAIAAGVVTERLGVEFLLGSFIAGVLASQMSPKVSLFKTEDSMNGVKLFSSFFMPFYFFLNGELISHEAITNTGILYAGLFCLFIPLRWAAAWMRYRLNTSMKKSGYRMSMSLLPTLIFTLVIAQILQRSFGVANEIVGGLIIYAFVNTLLPSLLLQKHKADPNPLKASRIK